jgi:tetratricopeptide (TPR) repeat protein
MEFDGLSDDEIFAKVADAEPSVRVDALMHMGMNRTFEKVDEAIGFYENAYELAESNGLREHRSHACRFLANALYLAKRNGDAKKVLEAEMSRELTLDISDLAFGNIVGQYAVLLADEGAIEDSLAKLEEASSILKTEEEKMFLPTFFNKVSQVLLKQNKFQLAANIGQRARSLAQETENSEELGMSLYFLGKAYEGMFMFDDSMKCYKEAFVLLDYRSGGDWELHAKLAIARLMWFSGDFDASLQELGNLRAVATGAPWADADLPARCDLQIARSLFAKSDFEGASNKYFQARTLLRAKGATAWAAVAEAEGAVVQLVMGNREEAVQSAETAMRWWSEDSTDYTELWVRLSYGKVMNATGNHVAALAVLNPEEVFDFNSDFLPHVEYRIELAEAMGKAGDSQAAAATAGVVLEFFNHVLSNNDRGRLQDVLAEAAVARNDLPEALHSIALAIQSFAADSNAFRVNQLSQRLIEIAAGEANRANNEVIDGL